MLASLHKCVLIFTGGHAQQGVENVQMTCKLFSQPTEKPTAKVQMLLLRYVLLKNKYCLLN